MRWAGLIRLVPVPWQQAVQFVRFGAARDDALQHAGEGGERLDAVQLGCGDQRVGHGPVSGSGIAAREQRILS